MERFCVATEKFYVVTYLARLGRFSVATKYFMSRQSWPSQGEVISRQSNSMPR